MKAASADLVVVEDHGQSPAEALQQMRPEMVMVRGKVRLVSARFVTPIATVLAATGIDLRRRTRRLVHRREPSRSSRRDRARSRPGVSPGGKEGIAVMLDSLPVLILNPHSRCNCRCAMCDIWKTTEAQEISVHDLKRQLESIERLHVQWVVLSGGEAADALRLCGASSICFASARSGSRC